MTARLEPSFNLELDGANQLSNLWFMSKKKNPDTNIPQALRWRKREQEAPANSPRHQEAPTTRPIKLRRWCRCCRSQRLALITTQTSGLGSTLATTATATGDRLMGKAVEAIISDREWMVLGDVTQSELSATVDLES
ncbi:hypothetical protein L6164_025511 [Bauhinia variegata]|uniref:Uncharacterized protein n=1 Tax=Bauhinia variegata TaxID=167791 RepID=A0ACB9M420_BAUVA|nr:hypothetical protein L6164_025511 [Bauhinia variegata]